MQRILPIISQSLYAIGLNILCEFKKTVASYIVGWSYGLVSSVLLQRVGGIRSRSGVPVHRLTCLKVKALVGIL